jgi:hypothetical protein
MTSAMYLGLADIFSQVAKTNRFGSCSGMCSSHGVRGGAVAVHGVHVACGSVRGRPHNCRAGNEALLILASSWTRLHRRYGETTFNNPPINLIDVGMIAELRELFARIERDEGGMDEL